MVKRRKKPKEDGIWEWYRIYKILQHMDAIIWAHLKMFYTPKIVPLWERNDDGFSCRLLWSVEGVSHPFRQSQMIHRCPLLRHIFGPGRILRHGCQALQHPKSPTKGRDEHLNCTNLDLALWNHDCRRFLSVIIWEFLGRATKMTPCPTQKRYKHLPAFSPRLKKGTKDRIS